MLLIFDPSKFDSLQEALEEVRKGSNKIISGNPEVFQEMKDMYEAGEIRELIVVADGRSYVADPDGVMREYPELEPLLLQVGWKHVKKEAAC